MLLFSKEHIYNNFNYYKNIISIFLYFLLTKLYIYFIIYFHNSFFIFFKLFLVLPKNYLVDKNSYEEKTKEQNKYILENIENNFYFDYKKFNIVIAWAELYSFDKDSNNDIINHINIITNIIHFIYFKNKQLTISDLDLIFKNYKNLVKTINIVFNIDKKLYIKIINFNTKKYNNGDKILFGNIFENKKALVFSDSESE
jgi:hypothetical protein